jgi:hypothetical protein
MPGSTVSTVVIGRLMSLASGGPTSGGIASVGVARSAGERSIQRSVGSPTVLRLRDQPRQGV